MRLTLRWLSVVAAASCWFSARLCCKVGSVSRQYFISDYICFSALDMFFVRPSGYHEYVWSVLVPFTFLVHTGLSSPSLCVYPFWDCVGGRPTGCWGMLHQCHICSMANVMHDNIRSSAPFEQGFKQYTYCAVSLMQ
jgi:hypothetical protein